MQKKGLLVSFEGIDGSGKSSLVQALVKLLEQRGETVLLTCEPGGTVLGKKLRVILHEEKEQVCDLAEYLLFAADRAQHFHQIVIPALEAGTIVISDRLADSSLAYQGYGRGLDLMNIRRTNEWAMFGVQPDITFYLKLDITVALERIRCRGQKLTSFETEQELFWQRVIKGYETIFQHRENVVPINATKPVDYLAQQVFNEVAQRL